MKNSDLKRTAEQLKSERIELENNFSELSNKNSQLEQSITNLNNSITENSKEQHTQQANEFSLDSSIKELRKNNKKAKSNFAIIAILVIAVLLNFYIYSNTQSTISKNQSAFNLLLNELNSKISTINTNAELSTFVLANENYSQANQLIRSLPSQSMQNYEYIVGLTNNYYSFKSVQSMPYYTNLDSGTSVIYPGALISGDSLFKGTPSVLPVNSTPVTLTSNIQNASSITTTDASYSSFNDAYNQLLNENEILTSKSLIYDVKEVISKDNVGLNLGVGLDITVINSILGLDASIDTSMNYVTVMFKETFYTISAEPKTQPADYFQTGTVIGQLGSTRPAYISDVDYGRVAILTVSSTESISNITSGLNTVLNNMNLGLDYSSIDFDASYSFRAFGGENISTSLNFTESVKEDSDRGFFGDFMYFFQGDAYDKSKESTSNSAYALAMMSNFIQNSNSSNYTNAIPISYTMKYIDDNTVVPSIYYQNMVTIPEITGKTMYSVSFNTSNIDIDKLLITLNDPNAILVSDSGIVNPQNITDITNLVVYTNSTDPFTISSDRFLISDKVITYELNELEKEIQ